jgi:hypothetical protein
VRYTRVKTTISFETKAGHRSQTVCCHHDSEMDSFVFCDENGCVLQLVGRSRQHIMKMIDAMDLLMFPFDGEELKNGVEYCENPWA